MKKLILGMLVLGVAIISTANNNTSKTESNAAPSAAVKTVELKGSVTDLNSKETLVGVEVQIEGTNLKTYTDFDGNFTFENLVPGKYKIVASYISYKKNIIENIEAELKNKNKIAIKMACSN